MKSKSYLRKAKIATQKSSKTRASKVFGKPVPFLLDDIEKTLDQARKVSKKYKMDPSKLVKPELNRVKNLKKQLMTHFPNRFGFETMDSSWEEEGKRKKKKFKNSLS